MGVEPLHLVIPVPDEDLTLFNPTVPEMKSAYVGHIGHYWTVFGIKYGGSKDPATYNPAGSDNITDQWDPEITNFQRITLATGIHGELWGDVNKEHFKGRNGGQPTLVIPEDIYPSFYPDGGMTWKDCNYWFIPFSPFRTPDTSCPNNIGDGSFGRNGNLKRYTGTPGKPFVIRQRGNKLWVLSVLGTGWTSGDHGDWGKSWGAILRVADVTETQTGWKDAYTESVDGVGNGIDMNGPPWETRYERSDLGFISDRVGSHLANRAHAAPLMSAHMFGVGRHQLAFIDDDTYQNNDWFEAYAEIVLIDPYEGSVSWLRATPGFESTGTDVQKQKYIRRVAPRDVPWSVSVTYDHTELWIGMINQPSQFRQFSVPVGEPDRVLDNIVLFDDNPPVLADATISPWVDDPEPRLIEITPPVLIKTANKIECRGYDRLPENELRGGIDCVIWHEGFRISELRNDGSGSDHAGVVDAYKTRQRNRPNQIPSITGAFIWKREWNKEDTSGNTTVKSTTTRNLFLEHSPPYDGYAWIPLAVTLTPFGDYIYVMISSNYSNTSTTSNTGWRKFLIVRPGHWEIETRVPATDFNDDLADPISSGNQFFDLSTQTGFNGAHSDREILKLTCNEHWVYLANFPQRITPTYDMTLGPVGPDNFIHKEFQTTLSLELDGHNLGEQEYDDLSLQERTNIFWDWAIDIYSGEIRVPFRTQYGNHWSTHSIYGVLYNELPSETDDTEINAAMYDEMHQNLMGFSLTDTPPSVRGFTPAPTFH